mmetsp:Transcript_25701/g.101351  ORF Transcript_25701/g.101351 Transcript_25701/m.101351 type:complete len:763 (-) Transcript_25701:366-2654(-)
MDDEELKVGVLVGYGVDPKAAKAASSSEKTYEATLSGLKEAGFTGPDPAKSALVYSIVTKLPGSVPPAQRNYLYHAVGDGRIASNGQLDAAMDFVGKLKEASQAVKTNANMQVKEVYQEIDDDAFDKYCGVGITVTDEEIDKVVDGILHSKIGEIKERRYQFKTGPLLQQAREQMRFVDGKIFLHKFDEQMAEILGPKTEADLKPPKKVKQKKEKAKAAKKATENSKEPGPATEADPLDSIPSVLEARELDSAKNSPDLVEKQKVGSGGKIVCRFPPEPNGYLHIGHAKAMFLDFGYAKKNGGDCILRFDDTNPEAEDVEYINAIIEMVEWLGHKPARITFSSDYFKELYELGRECIRRDKAYVCHQTPKEASSYREEKKDSPWRDRPIEESLRLFEDMKKGKFGEGEATLRLKIDMTNANPVMRDPIAYRIKFSPHPRTGNQWCIYPSYDFTHCLVDSLEWVTHSLCTLEFEIRRDSYYWLLEALDMYRPFVWEFSRLTLENTIVSKRKLLKLVKGGHVRGWDDPRLPTLVALRRRGFPPKAVNRFCASIGVSRADSVVGMHSVEWAVRSELDSTVPRAKAVLRPLKVTITNFEEDHTEVLQVPNHPQKESMGKHDQVLSKHVFIDQTDFRMEDEKGYYGLAPEKTAMLRHAYPITVKEVLTDDEGVPEELLVVADTAKSTKPKGVLHWVSAAPFSAPAEVRLYDRLFKSAEVSDDTWLEDLNPESEVSTRATGMTFCSWCKCVRLTTTITRPENRELRAG